MWPCMLGTFVRLSVVLCILLILPLSANAGTYSFTEIADTSRFTQGFGAFGPAINNAGEVAFKGHWDGGGQGIFTGSGGPLTVVADTASGFTAFGDQVRINEGGTVAFRADATVGTGIFTGTGGSITPIVTTGSTFTELFGHYINNNGTVVFHASTGGGVGIFTGSGGAVKTITDTTGAFSLFGSPAISTSGTVAFFANVDTGGAGFLRSIHRET